MRKTNDARKMTVYRKARIQGYHEDGGYDREQYAFNGFKKRLYFTSDRTIALDERFRRPDGQPLKGYGLEIETECWTLNDSDALAEVLSKICFTPFPANLFKMQRDGSLQSGGSSAECITQVMTREFIRNNYGAFKLLYDFHFVNFGISASRSGNCGMHVNISNGVFGKTESAQELAVRKLFYIVNKFFKTMCTATGRNPDRTTYCGRMSSYVNAKTIDFDDLPQNHYVCFNFAHYRSGRIELRFVGGQPDFNNFRCTMETIFWLCERVKTISWDDCNSAVKIFSGCNQYVQTALYKASRAGHLTPEAYRAISDAVECEDFEVEIDVIDD